MNISCFPFNDEQLTSSKVKLSMVNRYSSTEKPDMCIKVFAESTHKDLQYKLVLDS